jgi:hypothetical protein
LGVWFSASRGVALLRELSFKLKKAVRRKS